MSLSSLIKGAHIKDRRDLYIALSAPLVGFLTVRLISNLVVAARYNGVLPKAPIYEAPTQHSPEYAEKMAIPYPPDVLPGGRNIPTPHGQVRAYEWGPKDGRKVLCIHGISTPSIALARMAHRLVQIAGCRVMLFDLFGRGYSDYSSGHRQDISLFTTQILAVLATSDLDWTNGFTMCGYSLGGGMSCLFTFATGIVN